MKGVYSQRTSLCSRSNPLATAAAPQAAAAAAARAGHSWASAADLVQQRQPPACRSSSSSSSQAAPTSGSRRLSRASIKGSPPSHGNSSSAQSKRQVLDPVIPVSVTTTSSGVATAVLMRLQQLGHAEVWATSAANHFTAVAGLALAAQQLQTKSLPRAPAQQAGDQQQQLQGLVVTATMTIHDQPVKDDQKRRLNKLDLQVLPAQQIDPAQLAAGQPGAISTNRTTAIADVLGFMQQQLLVPQDSSSSRVKPGVVCVVEARGEQAVTRAVKAALSLQAAAGQPLLLRPMTGKVVDIVAEKRGQSQLADGLLLLLTW